MADIAAIRTALAARLTTLLDGDGQASAYMLDNPSPPTLHVVGITGIDYDQTFGRGGDTITFQVQGVAAGLDRGHQEQLDDWLDGGVKNAIESERPSAVTLGGIVDSCRVVSTAGMRTVLLPNGTPAVAAEWEIQIETSPDP